MTLLPHSYCHIFCSQARLRDNEQWMTKLRDLGSYDLSSFKRGITKVSSGKGIPGLKDGLTTFSVWAILLPLIIFVAAMIIHPRSSSQTNTANLPKLSSTPNYNHFDTYGAGASNSSEGPRWGYILMSMLFALLMQLFKEKKKD
ncbi:hypothetical protein SELMODRAFT_415651 [Selaginella moellendorffii]|uniref:Uncharacterized protein n=1 Tax=Selaginella moellendorffii TaxID=88036 RepID=D8RWT6_SELML|nr:hypothetical protein SELMODRAFT_415651 [Selaginella moellendorffii]